MDSLVDYESSDSEHSSCDEQPVGTKRAAPVPEHPSKRRTTVPALPAFFSPVISDETKDAKGRVRSKPATRNSWATHVYFQLKRDDALGAVISATESDLVHPLDDIHISISKCLYLKDHETEGYSRAIQDALTRAKRFVISFAQLAVLTNEDKTRSFLTAEVGRGYHDLVQCMHAVDKVNAKYNQPPFYDPPRFHASLLWSLTEAPLQDAIARIPEDVATALCHEEYHVAAIHVKSGDRIKVYKMP
ncbi:hypothetical protein BC940DRAFT_291392 [Gongronella butleri]|nr:hypothetical protein BC940DRAFT_291392 [Gongronella butleri]